MWYALLCAYCKSKLCTGYCEWKKMYEELPDVKKETRYNPDNNHGMPYVEWLQQIFHEYFSFEDFMIEYDTKNAYGFKLHPRSTLL